MAYKADYPLGTVNIGNNLLSGPVPILIFKPGYSYSNNYNVVDYLTELWLQGNPWDGPCAALCEVNTVPPGQMDKTKFTTAREWTWKCRALGVDAHKLLPDNKYSVSAEGSCNLKASSCGEGQLYVKSRTVADPDCVRCPVHTFQPKSDHKETECYNQPTCGPAFSISKDNDDLRTQNRSCNACDTGTYQAERKHRLTECIAQPNCTVGQYITEDFKSARRVCKACPPGEYQNQEIHHKQ